MTADAARAANRLVLQDGYRRMPHEWMVDRLGIRRETLDWGAMPQYAKHRWDGTPNPLIRVCTNIAQAKWTAVESATGTGKTFLGACLMLWWLETFPQTGRVVTIAPKADQLALHIWAEAGGLYPKFGRGLLKNLELQMEERNDKWVAVGFVAGVSTKEAQTSASRAQGFHAPDLLIIFEETPGIQEAVMAAFENTATAPNNVLLAFGNPNSQTDTLHRFASRKDVDLVRISGFDHPNVVLRRPDFIAGAQTELGLARLLQKYRSEEHPMYKSRAKGLSPEHSTDSLISWDWCRTAVDRGLLVKPNGPSAFGVDVANSEDGDQAVIAFGTGSVLHVADAFPCPDSNALGRRVHTEAKQHGIVGEYVGVDGVGVGAGTVNELHRLGMKCRSLIGGAKAIELYERGQQMQEQFENLRAQMWYQLRVDLQFGEQSGLVLPDDEELLIDLTTPRWGVKKGKVIFVEGKEEIKKRLGRSPNKGDAAVYWNWVRARRLGVAAHAMPREEVSDKLTYQDLVADPYKAERRRLW